MIIHITTVYELEEHFDDINNREIVGYDTEFNDTELYSIQIGDLHTQYVIDISRLPKTEIVRELTSSLLSNNSIKLFANSKADICVLDRHGYRITNAVCLMLAEQLLYAGIHTPKGFFSLDGIVERYCGHSREDKKYLQTEIYKRGIDSLELLEYAALDVKHLEIVYKHQLTKLINLGMANENPLDLNTVLGLECKAAYAFAMLENCGMKVDVSKFNEIDMSIDAEINSYKEKLYVYASELVGEQYASTINWNSWQQKLPVLRMIDPTVEDTRKESLLKRKDIHPIFYILSELSKLSKLKSSFTKKLPTFVDDKSRVHPDVFQIKSTGRISVGNPPLQQIPSKGEIGKSIRACFVSEENTLIVSADYSSAELRIIASMSQDPLWLEIMNNDGDLHSELCARTFDIDISQVRDPFPHNPDLSYRDVQKTINFGLAYGAGPSKLATVINQSVSIAEEVIEKFFNVVPKVKEFLNNSARQAKLFRFSLTPVYNRYRFYSKGNIPEYKLAEIGRQGKNAPIQGANADIVKRALVQIHDYLVETFNTRYEDMPIKIIGQVHDEILTECSTDHLDYWPDMLKQFMIEAAGHVIRDVAMPVDVTVSPFWKK